ncbi:MAG: phosphocholine cytidylyltransferase family protein [Deltaproteobacteria bacterium]|jgi:choline kinase|nr:phosphocholine cytidylyltransferase family protein [Deltaproteobacteria bacterium]
MKAVILAAGRGSRLGPHCADIPKCLVELAGKPLLLWQLEALAKAGINDVIVVAGYKSEKIHDFLSASSVKFNVVENDRWFETNMLSSLLCASKLASEDDAIVSYSDIVYPSRHIEKLMKNRHSIAITYDVDWYKLWSLRNNQNPLADAETFRQKDGELLEIGGKPENLDQAQGQYMGLIKLTVSGWRTWLTGCADLGERVDKTDMTSFISRLLKENHSVGATSVEGAWCEVDTDKDLELYEKALLDGRFSHDWRE